MLMIFKGVDEVLVFELDEHGMPILDGYFSAGGGQDDRDPDDYDVETVEGPICISSVAKADPSRILSCHDEGEVAVLLKKNVVATEAEVQTR